MSGKFYFVGTPIGNLKDFSINQIETLKEVDIICCEDTRTSRTLLTKYEINKKLVSFHKFNYKEVSPKIIESLLKGENVALISDAGMPVISDPGQELIPLLKENNISYTAIGGVSAFLNAFVLSGYSAPFTFVGFLPSKNKEKKELLLEYRNLNSVLIFYSSVHNVEEDIKCLYENLGERDICIARELTKCYEEIIFTTLSSDTSSITKKGEFVIVVDKPKETTEEFSIDERYAYYLNLGYGKNDAIKLVSKDKKVSKSEIYNYIVKKDK